MWKLKEDQPAFEMVDGPHAGKSYRHGESYAEVPPTEAWRFAKEEAAHVASKPKKKAEEEVSDAQ